MFGRIALFILTNVLIIATLSVLISLFGVGPYLTESGLDYQSLFTFCMIWGMGGSIISLMMSRISAKMLMGVQVIDPAQPGQFEWLVQTVHNISKQAGLRVMPEVGVFDSPEPNAFATGPTKNRSLVAVSTGILSSMNKDQLEGVLGHEITHITNGDMVTMTLLQGVMNAFVMFFARIVAFVLTQNSKPENRTMMSFMITQLLQIVFGIFGMLVVCWFSRKREYRADAGSAKLVGAQDMKSALQVLKQRQDMRDPMLQVRSMDPYKISGKTGNRESWFATHPPLEKRIAALAQYA